MSYNMFPVKHECDVHEVVAFRSNQLCRHDEKGRASVTLSRRSVLGKPISGRISGCAADWRALADIGWFTCLFYVYARSLAMACCGGRMPASPSPSANQRR